MYSAHIERVCLIYADRILNGIERDMSSIVKCGPVKKVLQLKENAEKIQDCTTWLDTPCKTFQVCILDIAFPKAYAM